MADGEGIGNVFVQIQADMTKLDVQLQNMQAKVERSVTKG